MKGMLENYLRIEKAILTTVAESYPQDISTQKDGKDHNYFRAVKSQLFCLQYC